MQIKAWKLEGKRQINVCLIGRSVEWGLQPGCRPSTPCYSQNQHSHQGSIFIALLTDTHCCFKSPALQIFLLQLRKETQVGFNNSEAALSLDYAWEQKQRGTDQDLSGHSKKARLTAEVSRYTEEAQGNFFSLGWHSCISFKPALTLCPCQQTRLNIGSHIWDKVQNLLKIYLLIFC